MIFNCTSFVLEVRCHNCNLKLTPYRTWYVTFEGKSLIEIVNDIVLTKTVGLSGYNCMR